jgi:hypothetical protein
MAASGLISSGCIATQALSSCRQEWKTRRQRRLGIDLAASSVWILCTVDDDEGGCAALLATHKGSKARETLYFFCIIPSNDGSVNSLCLPVFKALYLPYSRRQSSGERHGSIRAGR